MTQVHTPGPWHCHCSDASQSLYRLGRANLGSVTYRGIVATHEETRANARLIAASPTLYEYATKQAKNGCVEAASMLASLHLTN